MSLCFCVDPYSHLCLNTPHRGRLHSYNTVSPVHFYIGLFLSERVARVLDTLISQICAIHKTLSNNNKTEPPSVCVDSLMCKLPRVLSASYGVNTQDFSTCCLVISQHSQSGIPLQGETQEICLTGDECLWHCSFRLLKGRKTSKLIH